MIKNVKFNAYSKHFVSLLIASFMFVNIFIEFDIFRLLFDDLFAFLFRVVSFASFDAMLNEIESIFSIQNRVFLSNHQNFQTLLTSRL